MPKSYKAFTAEDVKTLMASTSSLACLPRGDEDIARILKLYSDIVGMTAEEASRHHRLRTRRQIPKESSYQKVTKSITHRKIRQLEKLFKDNGLDSSLMSKNEKLRLLNRNLKYVGKAPVNSDYAEAILPTESELEAASNNLKRALTDQMVAMCENIMDCWDHDPGAIKGDAYDVAGVCRIDRESVFNLVKQDHKVEDADAPNPSGLEYSHKRESRCRREYRMDVAIAKSLGKTYEISDFDVIGEMIRQS